MKLLLILAVFTLLLTGCGGGIDTDNIAEMSVGELETQYLLENALFWETPNVLIAVSNCAIMAAKLRHHFEGCRKQNIEEEPVLMCIPLAGAWPRNWPVFIRPSHRTCHLTQMVRKHTILTMGISRFISMVTVKLRLQFSNREKTLRRRGWTLFTRIGATMCGSEPRTVKRTTSIVRSALVNGFIVSLFCGTIAHADLGTCLVLRGTNSHLDGELTQKASKAIYRAYEVSDNSDGNAVFILDIAGDAPHGSYEIQRLRVVLNDSQTIHGYRITASHSTGILNGVAEIKMAFEAGRIDYVKVGKRARAVAKPQLRD